MSNPLTNLLPASIRRDVYAVVAVASAAFGIWQATGGNWTAFAAGVIGALTSALAHGNVQAPPAVVNLAVESEPFVAAVKAVEAKLEALRQSLTSNRSTAVNLVVKDAPAVATAVKAAVKKAAVKKTAPAKTAAPAAKK